MYPPLLAGFERRARRRGHGLVVGVHGEGLDGGAGVVAHQRCGHGGAAAGVAAAAAVDAGGVGGRGVVGAGGAAAGVLLLLFLEGGEVGFEEAVFAAEIGEVGGGGVGGRRVVVLDEALQSVEPLDS